MRGHFPQQPDWGILQRELPGREEGQVKEKMKTKNKVQIRPKISISSVPIFLPWTDRDDGVLYYDSENFVHTSKGELSVFDRLPTASLIVRCKKRPGCGRMTKTGKDDTIIKGNIGDETVEW